MKLRIRRITHAPVMLALAAAVFISGSQASAQGTAKRSRFEPSERVELFDSLETRNESGRTKPDEVQSQKPTAKEIRQARAMYESQQRMLRRQRNLWLGYEPLRPQFNTTPMMNSRYGRPTIYVPYYVR